MSKKLKLYGGLTVLFLLGVIIGSLGTGVYIRNEVNPFYEGSPMNRRAMILNRLVSKLSLTPEQKIEVESVLDKTQTDLMELRNKNLPEISRILEKRFSLIREKLNKKQQKQLDKIRKKIKERLEKPGELHSFSMGPSGQQMKGHRGPPFLRGPP